MSGTSLQEARRMRLRGIVRVAGDVLPSYWPMRTFVHHNPLHGLESQPFDRAVRQGERLFGGRGYLPAEVYRGYLAAGRITRAQLEEALGQLGAEGSVQLGGREVTRREVLLACLTHGVGEGRYMADAELAARLEAHVPTRTPEELGRAAIEAGRAALARTMTLAEWCDRVLGTEIERQVNDELVKWCAAFLDEGQATWPMPGRKHGFYLAWKSLAAREWRPCGIPDSRKAIRDLPDLPEDAILESLAKLGIPEDLQQDYLELELASLPGWTAFIKWRAEQRDHPWQQAYPINLVKYLAVRLWYKRELVQLACRKHLGLDGDLSCILAYMQEHPREFLVRETWVASRSGRTAAPELVTPALVAERLTALAGALGLPSGALLAAEPEVLLALWGWLKAFPLEDRDPVWQRAFEAGYQEALIEQLARPTQAPPAEPIRPQSQSMYCIDVRTEVFRRHLEAIGDHETYAFGGFFGAAIRFRRWGREGHIDQVPAIMQPRNEVKEVPRTYHEHLVPTHRARARWLYAGHALLRDLKENVVTPYVMVESLGWFYGLPLVGKTLAPSTYKGIAGWFKKKLLPPIPTSLTVDKLSPAEVENMVASEQRDTVWKTLRARFGVDLDPRLVEAVRLYALGDGADPTPEQLQAAEALGLTPAALEELVQTLRRDNQIEARSASRRKERLTRRGFTVEEQVLTVETVLRTMGLTRNFARVVLVCGHGSTTENNPYESALDCGACGGNEGSANARSVAMMANNPKVRERLAKAGIVIPADTHFVGGQLDTTTDVVRLYDLEDVPPANRRDIARLAEDLAQAGRLTTQERLARLPDAMDTARRVSQVWERSADWSQVRPEWGLSGNAAFIIGPRSLTKGLDLGGRVFMHSYEHALDPNGRLLEVILTGAQPVAQWICMEHYFSTTGDEVYGSGSKVYHNVTGRVGVMSGPASDLRLGLARQTVMSGDRPFHEPMRLTTIVAARRATLDALIARHLVLQHYYRREWVHLVAWDPTDGLFYRYQPAGGWSQIALHTPQLTLGKEPIA